MRDEFHGTIETIKRKRDGVYWITFAVARTSQRGPATAAFEQHYPMEIDVPRSSMTPFGDLAACMDVYHVFEFDAGLNPQLRRQWKTAWIADQIAAQIVASGVLRPWTTATEAEVIQCRLCQRDVPNVDNAAQPFDGVCRVAGSSAIEHMAHPLGK